MLLLSLPSINYSQNAPIAQGFSHAVDNNNAYRQGTVQKAASAGLQCRSTEYGAWLAVYRETMTRDPINREKHQADSSVEELIIDPQFPVYSNIKDRKQNEAA